MRNTLISSTMFFITMSILMMIFEGKENQRYLTEPFEFFGGILLSAIIYGLIIHFVPSLRKKRQKENSTNNH